MPKTIWDHINEKDWVSFWAWSNTATSEQILEVINRRDLDIPVTFISLLIGKKQDLDVLSAGVNRLYESGEDLPDYVLDLIEQESKRYDVVAMLGD